MWEENTTLTLGHTIEGVRGHTLEGHRVEGNALEGHRVEGQILEGHRLEEQILEGQTVEGYSEASEAGNFSVDWRQDLDVALFQVWTGELDVDYGKKLKCYICYAT